jgi:hypothetical protein
MTSQHPRKPRPAKSPGTNPESPHPARPWRTLLEILIGLALLEGLFVLFKLGASHFSPPT